MTDKNEKIKKMDEWSDWKKVLIVALVILGGYFILGSEFSTLLVGFGLGIIFASFYRK